MKTQRSKSKRTRLSQEEYTSIKQVLDLGVPTLAVREMTGRASGTLSAIKRSTSFSEYCEIRDKWAETYRAKQALKQPKKTEQAELEIETTAQELPNDTAVAVLRSIDEKMGRMIELLEALNTRKRGIF